MAGLARRVSLIRGSRADPEITIGSFIIEFTQGGTVHRPGFAILQAEVNVNDRMAVLSAREGPLITVNKRDVPFYRVGFTYYVNYGADFANYVKHGALSIGAKHKVLLPKQFKSSYKSAMCPAWDTVNPVRNAVQYQPLAEILYHGQPSVTPPHYGGAPIAEYTVQSFLQQSNGKGEESGSPNFTPRTTTFQMFQAKSFLWSHRPDLIFDGSEPSLSFAEFIRSIDVVLDMAHERADDVLPTFLYGDALRFYETLDPECQHSWEKLRDAMFGVTEELKEKMETNASGEVVEKGLKHKKSDIWLGKLKDRLRIPSFARGAKSDNVVDPSNPS
ncbi:hypothetical protein FRC05_004359 [Tulasnella sp. 425]|nr:hypothetical protein FRC05_004359 [Tulasnella sp. 425]